MDEYRSQVADGDVARDAAGAVDEDLYCLTCGYDLRGLAGDPLRCPECGGLNDLGTVSVPADAIRQALDQMETAPTTCTALALAAAVALSTGWFLEGLAQLVALVLALIAVGEWAARYKRMQTEYDNQPGWRSVLRDFHLATASCISAVPIVVALFRMLNLTLHDDRVLPAAGASLVLSLPLIVLGLRRYDEARRRLSVLQREKAVRVARRILLERMRPRRPGSRPERPTDLDEPA